MFIHEPVQLYLHVWHRNVILSVFRPVHQRNMVVASHLVHRTRSWIQCGPADALQGGSTCYPRTVISGAVRQRSPACFRAKHSRKQILVDGAKLARQRRIRVIRPCIRIYSGRFRRGWGCMASCCSMEHDYQDYVCWSYLAMRKALHPLGLYVPPCQVIAENLYEALVWVFYFTSTAYERHQHLFTP